jgi:Ubiquitin elongating factor core/U-box domain
LKFDLRHSIEILIERAIQYKTNKIDYGDEETFVKFMNMLLNDVGYLLDEGIETLLKIRRAERGEAEAVDPREEQRRLNRQQEETMGGNDQGQVEQQEQQQEEGEEGPSRSVQDPKEHCKQYNMLSKQAVSTLHLITKDTAAVVMESRILLEQLVTCCLNPCLDRLVGPRSLALKGQQKGDFEVYNFDPKFLLNKIVEIYVFLSGQDEPRLMKVVSEDLRYYKPETFRKAVVILKRERLISDASLKAFENFVKKLNELATAKANALDSVEIPDSYLDPLMAELMIDPVLLPGSGMIMDRRHITRIILSDDHDPFNRMPLKKEDLIPQDGLRNEIRDFCNKHGISHLETDDY